MAELKKICPKCGMFFTKPQNISTVQWEKRIYCSNRCSAMKDRIDDKQICEMYIAKRLSSTEIGQIAGLSGAHVLRILKNNAVSIRPASENKTIALNRPATKEKTRKSSTGRKQREESKDKLRKRIGPLNHNWRAGLSVTVGGYIQFTNSRANGVHANRYLHDIIAEYKYGRPLRRGEHVHHIDSNKMNNDPSNLIIMAASDHSKIHTEDRENGKFKRM